MFFVEGWGCFGWFVGQIRGEKLKRRRTNYSCYVQFYVLLHCLFFLFTTECVFVHISVPLFCTCVTISKCICVCNCKRMRVLLYLFLTVSVKSWRRRGRKKKAPLLFLCRAQRDLLHFAALSHACHRVVSLWLFAYIFAVTCIYLLRLNETWASSWTV